MLYLLEGTIIVMVFAIAAYIFAPTREEWEKEGRYWAQKVREWESDYDRDIED